MNIVERMLERDRAGRLRWLLERGRLVEYGVTSMVSPSGRPGRRIHQKTRMAMTKAEADLERAATRLLAVVREGGAE